MTGWLWKAFESGVRGDTFDRMLDEYPDLAARMTVGDLVRAYREHTPAIELIPRMADTLDAIQRRGLRLGVLSDGPAASQSAKAAALRLERWFDPIILTGTLGAKFAKPATAGFELIARAWCVDGSTLAYVADNPAKDFAGPRLLGWTTVRLRHPQQLRFSLEPTNAASRPDLEIGTPAELLQWLGIE